MKKILLYAQCLIFIAGFGQNQIPNLQSFLIGTGGSVPSNISALFDNNTSNSSPSQPTANQGCTASNGCIGTCQRWIGSMGNGTHFDFDLLTPVRLNQFTISNIIAPRTNFTCNNNENNYSTTPKFEIYSAPSSIGPWTLVGSTSVTASGTTSANASFSFNKVSRFWRISISDAPDISIFCSVCSSSNTTVKPVHFR